MIFTTIKTESIVQIGDKTRLIVDSFISGGSDTITLIEIDPDTSGTFYDITSKSYFDWAYPTEAVVTATVRVTDSGASVDTVTRDINIVSETTDNLFSRDSDLVAYEPDLIKWIQSGRNSYIDKHRAAQIEILGELDANRIWKDNDEPYTASDIVLVAEFTELSKFTTLRIIFEGISNSIDDVFHVKALRYKSLATTAKKRATLRLDSDGDGVASTSENVDVFSMTMRRC